MGPCASRVPPGPGGQEERTMASRFPAAAAATLVLLVGAALAPAEAQSLMQYTLPNVNNGDAFAAPVQARDGYLYGLMGNNTPTIYIWSPGGSMTSQFVGSTPETSYICLTGMIPGRDGNLYGTCQSPASARRTSHSGTRRADGRCAAGLVEFERGAGGTFIFDPSESGSPVVSSGATVAAVPEPGTLALLIAGAVLLAMYRKRSRPSSWAPPGSRRDRACGPTRCRCDIVAVIYVPSRRSNRHPAGKCESRSWLHFLP